MATQPVITDTPIPAPDHAATPLPPVKFETASSTLIAEITALERDSFTRYTFNNRWDIVLSVLGILLSIGIVGAGFQKERPWIASILGAIVGAVVTAQKAFPFGPRAAFYRILIGQSRNLSTRASQQILGKAAVIDALSSLRMDFAQQLPRGTSAAPTSASAPVTPDKSADPHPQPDTEEAEKQ